MKALLAAAGALAAAAGFIRHADRAAATAAGFTAPGASSPSGWLVDDLNEADTPERDRVIWAHGHDTGEALGAYPQALLVLSGVDRSHGGVCVAMLREHFADCGHDTSGENSGGNRGEDAGATADASAPAQGTIPGVEDPSPHVADPDDELDPRVATLVRGMGYEEVLRSCVETAYVLSGVLVDSLSPAARDAMGIAPGGQHVDPYDSDQRRADAYLRGARLAALCSQHARAHEIALRCHRTHCASCRTNQGRTHEDFVIGFYRDLADDMLTNPFGDEVAVNGVPIGAVFAVVSELAHNVVQVGSLDAEGLLDVLERYAIRAARH